MQVKIAWWFPLCRNEPVEIIINEENILMNHVAGHKPGIKVRFFGETKEDCIRKHNLYCTERAAFFKDRVERLKDMI